jgi:cell division protein FtsB
MTLRTRMKKIGRAMIWPAVSIVLIAYFGLNLVEGDRGLIAWTRLTREVQVAQTSLDATEAEKNALEHRASLLRPEHLDPDMLDERARASLNLIGGNEVVIFTPAEKP